MDVRDVTPVTGQRVLLPKIPLAVLAKILRIARSLRLNPSEVGRQNVGGKTDLDPYRRMPLPEHRVNPLMLERTNRVSFTT